MKLEDKILKTQNDLRHYKKEIKLLEEELKDLENSMLVSDGDLYNNITDYIEVNKHMNKKYEHILGGDGRSSAWSETRKGVVLELKIFKGYYLTQEQKDKVKSILKIIHSANEIKYI